MNEELDELLELRPGGPLDVLGHRHHDVAVAVERDELVGIRQLPFEKAGVVHMGDLVFNRRHPFIDRPAGESIANWIKVLEQTVKDHSKDTIYIHGHSSPRFGVTGPRADLLYMRDYLSALLEFVRGEMKAGKPKDAIVKVNEPLKGFTDHGPLIERVLVAACEELGVQ